MIDEFIAQFADKAKPALAALDKNLKKIRTGRAHPSLVEDILVDSYGSLTPIVQVASVTVNDARTLSITPWDKNLINAIEKAILESHLGLNPMNQGHNILLPLPPLTKERRVDLTKIVGKELEQAKISIRNLRRDILTQAKQATKNKDISEDDEKRIAAKIQDHTNSYMDQIETLGKAKEKEIMEI